MTASLTINLPEIGKRDAFHNAITYTKYEAELKKGNVLSFGIYRGKRFVLLRDSDAFLIKLHYRICRLFMLIRINQEAIEPLHKSSQIRLSKLPPIELATHIKENYEEFERGKKELEEEWAKKIREEREKAKKALEEAEKKVEEVAHKIKDAADEEKEAIKKEMHSLRENHEKNIAEFKTKLEAAKSKGRQLKEAIKTQAEEFKIKIQEFEAKHDPKKKHSEHSRDLKKENKRLTAEVDELKQKLKVFETAPEAISQEANFGDAEDVFSRIKVTVDNLPKEEQKKFSKELTEKLKKAYLHHTLSHKSDSRSSHHSRTHSRHSLEIPKEENSTEERK